MFKNAIIILYMREKEGKKILIIEENKIFREMLTQKLEAKDYFVVLIEGNVSLEEIKKIKPDLLLIDIVSTKKEGVNLIKQLKQEDQLAVIPIIAIAKMEKSVVVDYAHKLGVKDTIDKVIFDSNDLFKKVKRALKVQEANFLNTASTESKKTTTQTSQQKSEEEKAKDGENGQVLLIEDDIFMRELFVKGFHNAGFTVDAAPDAETGLEKLDKKIPDIILLDLLLPGKNGFEFLEEIKQNNSYRHIPVIIVSNLGSKGDVDRAKDLGAADFLVKANSTIDEIITKTKKFIEKGKKMSIIPKSLK